MSLKSAGYDAVLLLNERVLNQLSGALYYNGFLRISQETDLLTLLEPEKKELIDPALQPFFRLKYRVQMLHEPSIDFMAPPEGETAFRMKLFLTIRAMITLWDGLEIPFDGKLSLLVACDIERIPETVKKGVGQYGETTLILPEAGAVSERLLSLLQESMPDYVEPGSYAMVVDFTQTEIETLSLSWQQKNLQGLSIDFAALLNSVLKAYFIQDGKAFCVGLPSFGAYPPELEREPENRIFADLAAIRVINGKALAIGFNLFGDHQGDPAQLTDFLRNCSIGIAMPEAAINKAIKFGWSQYLKKGPLHFEKQWVIDKSNSTFNTISTIINLMNRIGVELLSLGLVEYDKDPKALLIDVGLDIWVPNLPGVDLRPGNIVSIKDFFAQVFLTVKVQVDLELTVEIDPTGWFPDIIPDIEVYHSRRNICLIDARILLPKVGFHDATARVAFDGATNRLGLELVDITMELDAAVSLFPGSPFCNLPDLFKPIIYEQAKKALIEQCRKIGVSPPLTLNLGPLPWKLNIRGRKLDIDAEEMTATMDAWFDPLKRDIPNVPKYIVNTNNMEVHLVGCDGLKDTYVEHQKGYHLLNDALNRGYDGCGRCLPAFHKRS